MIFSADATTHVIATIHAATITTDVAVLSGLLSFYSAVVTREALEIPAVATTITAVIVFGLSFYSYAVVTETLSANLRTFYIRSTYSGSAAVSNRRSIFLI